MALFRCGMGGGVKQGSDTCTNTGKVVQLPFIPKKICVYPSAVSYRFMIVYDGDISTTQYLSSYALEAGTWKNIEAGSSPANAYYLKNVDTVNKTFTIQGPEGREFNYFALG